MAVIDGGPRWGGGTNTQALGRARIVPHVGIPAVNFRQGQTFAGEMVADIQNGVLYVNEGDQNTPDWVVVGTQT